MMTVKACSSRAVPCDPGGRKTTGRRAILAACAAAAFWPALGTASALAASDSAEDSEGEIQMIAVSLPAGVLDGGPAPETAPYPDGPPPGVAGGEDKPIAADGKPIKGPLAPAGPEDDFAARPLLSDEDTGLLVGSQARKDADLLRDPSLSADHGAPDVRLAPSGPSGGRSR